MGYSFKSPGSDQEWHDYFQLRWLILRAPWQQPHGSERDELEDAAFHVMCLADNRHIVGAGRLHRLSDTSAQIRYMAVDPRQQGKGIGSQLLRKLEDEAKIWGCQEILLNARTTSLDFYQKHNYQIIGDAPVLFGRIAHKQMRKQLT
jgi:GNAT superfamily N-acetyltransferase